MTDDVGTSATTGTDGEAARLEAADAPASRNEVVLVGRVPAAPEERELPSGDRLVSWRVVVTRPPGRAAPPGGRTPTVDTLDCVAWSESLRRAAVALEPGDLVEVHGGLRRRFWRAGAATASRCEVEATLVRRLGPAAPAPCPVPRDDP